MRAVPSRCPSGWEDQLKRVPTPAAPLSVRAVRPEGGETELASMRVGYERLVLTITNNVGKSHRARGTSGAVSPSPARSALMRDA